MSNELFTEEQQEELNHLAANEHDLEAGDKRKLRKLRKLKAKAEEAVEAEKKKHVYSSDATTKINPTPVRFLKQEKTVLNNIIKDLRENDRDLVMNVLGRMSDVNKSKLIRASIHLMKNHSNEEIVEALLEARIMMAGGK